MNETIKSIYRVLLRNKFRAKAKELTVSHFNKGLYYKDSSRDDSYTDLQEYLLNG